jgi:hypothetical protein
VKLFALPAFRRFVTRALLPAVIALIACTCLARGYERTGFFEIYTGEQRSWTVQLTESHDSESPTSGTSVKPMPSPGVRTTPERESR